MKQGYRMGILGIAVLCGCSPLAALKPGAPAAPADLAAQGQEFRREVIRVAEGVHVAVGFGLANSVLLEGRDGVVIVDTMESAEAARPVKEAFEKISPKPVKAIVYTHFHTDHTFGTQVLAGGDRPEIWAHESTSSWLSRVLTLTRETVYRRSLRQFGSLLPAEEFLHAGIGPRLVFDEKVTPALLLPTRTFAGERAELEISGIRMVLIHAPGETPDQTVVWLPDKKVLLAADNFYKSFPNLYAIRGTAYRDVNLWVRSLDLMRELGAEHLVPLHTRPISGAERIFETLTNYRDAIQFVHDQTIRWMNKGLPPEEIVAKVILPPHLAAQPYLREYYGTVAWSVRGIFEGYLGWFGGNATDLFPLPPGERAQRLADLAGGKTALLEKARQAFSAGDYQWALELADPLRRLDPDNREIRDLKGAALRALGLRQTAATARNYYLTQAREEEGNLDPGKPPLTAGKELIQQIPLEALFRAMTVSLDPDKSAAVDQVVGFRFPDTGEAFGIHVRRGVAEIQPRFPDRPEIAVFVDSGVWKEMLAGRRSPALTIARDIKVDGGVLNLIRFLRMFAE
jgi:alkyl sulfatase BDS1-like metallo-beta-lactamase superfamily hydrolase